MSTITYMLLLLLAWMVQDRSVVYASSSTVPWTSHQSFLQIKKNCLAQKKLVCVLQGTKGSRVTGTISFRPVFRIKAKYGERCVVFIKALVQKLKKGNHGFHIHEFGDMRKDDASFHGAHFMNPAGIKVPHGLPNDNRRHWGDLGNLLAWGGGNAKYARVDSVITISAIVGRSIVVHADEDVGVFGQPSGNSGARIASCVIGYANTGKPL